MKSRFIFRDRSSGFEIPALRHATINSSSDEFEWEGIRLEVGTSRGMHVDDVMVDGHYVGINLTEMAWHFEARSESGKWVNACMPPQTFWINPEGRPFSIQHDLDLYWASAVIDGKYLDSVAGHHFELRQGIGIADGLLAYLMRSLVINLHDRKSSFVELDAELVRAFVMALAKRHGYPAAELHVKGGIAPYQINSLLLWLEEHLHESLTIEAMASRVGYSAAHFTREFKRSVGLTPWGYVVQQRLDRAHKLLCAGNCLVVTASKCGFSDQFHMSRLFKQRFGLSPSVFMKEIRLGNDPV